MTNYGKERQNTKRPFSIINKIAVRNYRSLGWERVTKVVMPGPAAELSTEWKRCASKRHRLYATVESRPNVEKQDVGTCHPAAPLQVLPRAFLGLCLRRRPIRLVP